MQVLDVGCSDTPHGELNVDIELHFHGRNAQPHILCDGLALPFPDNSFPLVRSQHVVEHVPDPYKFVKELGRVSSKWLYVACPNPNAFRTILKDRVSFLDSGHYYHGHTAAELRLMYKLANFELIWTRFGWAHTRKKRKLDSIAQFIARILPNWDIQRFNLPEIRVLGRKNQ